MRQSSLWYSSTDCNLSKLFRKQTFTFQFTLTDRNIQARYGLRMVWES